MKKLILGWWIACIVACNPSFTDKTVVEGRIEGDHGATRILFEIHAQDTTVVGAVNDSGFFRVELPVGDKRYVRIVYGKAVFPLFVRPGENIRLNVDPSGLQQGNYTAVTFEQGENDEIRMMVHYYLNQHLPATEELFVLPPAGFRSKVDSITRFNDHLITYFSENTRCDPDFISQFRIQVQLPLAISYYYYPVYHPMMNPDDRSETPEEFNLFDKTLPKNDLFIYNNVYRYKTYEVSYWHHLLSARAEASGASPEEALNAYIDRLVRLDIAQQIKDDIGRNLVMQNIGTTSAATFHLLKTRYTEFIWNNTYRHKIAALLEKRK